MALKLVTGALPKGAGGRKPAEIDQELYAALLEHLKKNPTIETDGETRPNWIGDSSRLFDTEGKASADGRRYAKPLAEKLDKTVRVRVIESKPGSGKFGWVVYVAPEKEATEAPAAQ